MAQLALHQNFTGGLNFQYMVSIRDAISLLGWQCELGQVEGTSNGTASLPCSWCFYNKKALFGFLSLCITSSRVCRLLACSAECDWWKTKNRMRTITLQELNFVDSPLQWGGTTMTLPDKWQQPWVAHCHPLRHYIHFPLCGILLSAWVIANASQNHLITDRSYTTHHKMRHRKTRETFTLEKPL